MRYFLHLFSIALCFIALMPMSVRAVSYNAISANNSFNTNLVVPMQSSKTVDGMFRHNSSRRCYTIKKNTSGAKPWEVFGTTGKNTNFYGGAAMGSATANKYVVTSVAGGQSAATNFSIPVVASRRTSKRNITPFSSTMSSATTRMNVYVAGQSIEDGNGNYYDEDAEDWLPIPGTGGQPAIGDTKDEGGKTYVWNGSEWVFVSEVDTVPIGDIPYFFMLLMALTYMLIAIRPRFI